MQVKEGLAVAVVEEEREVTEMTIPQVALEPPARIGSGGEDAVMTPVDDGTVPPPPEREHEVAMSGVPESSTTVTATPIEGVEDMLMSWYQTIPGIGTIDLDAAEIPSNDREILEAMIERVLADTLLLDAIVLDPLVSRQDGDVGGSVNSTAPEAAEEVLGESAVGVESAAMEPPPTTAGEATDAPLLQLVEASTVGPMPSVVGTVEGVVGGAGPSPPQPAVTAMEEVPVPS
jgi:hypothetical protein